MTSSLRTRGLAAAAVLAVCLVRVDAAEPVPAGRLAPPQSFDAIADTHTRSAAIFTELGKVLTSPRCTNCHPAGDRPRQGDHSRPHQPPVFRGPDGFGTASMRCGSCHGAANFGPGRMPGHSDWHLAPRSMAWEGRSVAEICEQIKDPARNGQRKVEDLLHHIGQDTLVGWAWAPGYGRTPAPGTQAEAGALVAAWIASGAACPLK
ncbi:Isoquinoline 1-oxidoreductase subunit [Methylobacterium sp. 37f]|uniref:Isoquinoline 1-oxidoreductase subunit n=1 Tax=Methylobacterium sp. 37f TaxID=2817058 RepID=UPI001FFC881E|nr:Isoquinoline 1-oxidoreductase subunit [Methylobacterium sp. 37f]MCK2053809.1 Isoquinoline 1-oxidoreductase subunit [Methylobacterium sp. 37f]